MGWFKKPLGISSNLEVRKKNKNIKIASTQFGVSCSCFSFFWGRKMENITMIYSDLQYSTSQLAVEWNLGKSQGPTNKMAGVAVERNPWPRPCSTTSRGWISQVVRWKKGIIFSFQKWNEMMIWRQSMWWINMNYRNDMISLEMDFFFCDVLGKLIKQTLLDTTKLTYISFNFRWVERRHQRSPNHIRPEPRRFWSWLQGCEWGSNPAT